MLQQLNSDLILGRMKSGIAKFKDHWGSDVLTYLLLTGASESFFRDILTCELVEPPEARVTREYKQESTRRQKNKQRADIAILDQSRENAEAVIELKVHGCGDLHVGGTKRGKLVKEAFNKITKDLAKYTDQPVDNYELLIVDDWTNVPKEYWPLIPYHENYNSLAKLDNRFLKMREALEDLLGEYNRTYPKKQLLLFPDARTKAETIEVGEAMGTPVEIQLFVIGAS